MLRALAGERLEPPPWWLMRQAGRYLPEYRALRGQAQSFIDFCLTPALAAEATLQPVRRFGMDAAIVFADILLVPRALGQSVAFGDDGPALAALDEASGLAGLQPARLAELDPVYETLGRVRAALPSQTALIGFAGAPWTVATYMVEGGSSRDFRRVKAWSYRDPTGFAALIDLIADATIDYLGGQIVAGADVVQLFDTWAGVLDEPGFERWVITPTQRIAAALKQRFPAVPLIGFPRGAGLAYEAYAVRTGVQAVGIDSAVPLDVAAQLLQPHVTLQGNLDPVALLVGGDGLRREVGRIRRALAGGAHVFNLGHGVLPQTPPEHVALLAQLLASPVAE
ncbi:MAG: uroporphyrinogen decarboxylase [Thiohalocapsa sp.]